MPKNTAPEVRSVSVPHWLREANLRIQAGDLFVESDGPLSAFTPDMATADGALIALWEFHSACRGLPPYMNMFNGAWFVYRNGRLIWRAASTESNQRRLQKLFARHLGIDTTREEIVQEERVFRPAKPPRIPALVARWQQKPNHLAAA
jgi:hypothetical protein